MSLIRYKGAILRPHPNGGYRAEINHAGACTRALKKTLKDAKAWVDRELPGILEGHRPLRAEEIAEYRAAVALLPVGIRLLDAVAAYRPASLSSVTIQTAYEQYLADKAAAGLRTKSLGGLRWSVGRLNAALGDRPVASVATADLLPLLDGLIPVTRDNFRRAWRTFFRWCMAAGFTERDPTAALSRIRADVARPGIFTVPEVRALLHAAQRVHGGVLAPYLAIGLFTGIRTNALHRLPWDAFGPEHVHVDATVDKMRSDRYVEIRPNLAAWVAQYRGTGRIQPFGSQKFYQIMAQVKRAARLRSWPKNAMRHSFASYLLALVQDSGKVAHQLGQRSPDVLFQHYRALVTKADAEAYFALVPSQRLQSASKNPVAMQKAQ